MDAKKRYVTPVTIALAVVALVGVGVWIYQLMGGLGVTGMNNGTSWGLYIASFMFFVGLSAGGLIVASSASIFNVKEYKKVALPAVLVSTVCICMAGMFVLIDLGGIGRVYQLLLSPNFMSPLLWDVCVITCYLVINLVYLFFMTSSKPREKAVKRVSRFALPIAILVHSVTAWIFGLQIANEGWHSAIMAPLFVISAMDSGLALLLISLVALRRAGYLKFEKSLMANLAGLLVTCIAIDGFMVGCEVLTMAYPQAEHGNALLGQMFAGATAPFFWGEIILGVVIPFAILVFAKNRQKTGLVMLSSALVIVGVFFKRIWLLLTSFIFPGIEGSPGLISGSSSTAHATGSDVWTAISAYVPTWVEVVVVLGVVSLGALAFIVLAKTFLVGRKPEPDVVSDAATGAQVA
ncbi:NrfD/PsrC family molybdoenzyme membrane anchor subunit [Gordonibacter sp.]|uniref:NrfD/PsrC family molybdoenzyme membrane anchor subunit n=1 Tax=Gordonibacter sp. TaxID=1968902 RepID=UPI002FC8CB22